MRQENECLAEDWKLVPFNSNIEMLSGYPFDSSFFNDSEGKPLIRIRNIISGETETYYKGEYSEEFLITKGDILVGMDGDFHIKKWQGSESLLNQRILKLYENNESEINLDFFYYLSQPFLLKVHKRTAGTTVKHLSTKDYKNASFKVPDYVEQQKIADVLSTVDTKIEIIDQQIAETQELKKGLMQRLLTKGIGHTEFKDSPLGKIPKSWEVVSVKEITKEHKQGFYTKDGYIEDGIRLARITDLNNPKVDFSEMPMLNISDSDYESYKIEKGDFLFARSGAIGRYGIVEIEEHPAVFASYLIRFRFNSDIINRFFGYFFESYLCSNQLRGITQGNANVNINAENIKSLKFPLAPFEEQEKIASIISSVDDKIEILKEKKEIQLELKKGLMQQLLTGKIRVNVN